MSLKELTHNGKPTRVFASEDGTLYSPDRNIKFYDSGSGYLTFWLCRGFTSKGQPTTIRKYLHRVIAEAFLENPENLPQVNHKDGNKRNNACSNLEWVSASSNIRHAEINGLNKNRKNVTLVVLTPEEVVECYTRVKAGETIVDVAKSLDKPRTTISSIINKRSRRDLTDPLDR